MLWLLLHIRKAGWEQFYAVLYLVGETLNIFVESQIMNSSAERAW
jgi:hypothetical protein